MRFLPAALVLLWSAAALGGDLPRRIVILGDSVAFGSGDESGKGLAGNFRGEVTNAAIPGSRSWQLSRVLRVERVREAVRHADAVVISIGGNDLFGDSRARLLSLLAPRLAEGW